MFIETRKEFVTIDVEGTTSRVYGDKRQIYVESMVHNMPSTTNKTNVIEKKVSFLKKNL